MNVPFFPLLGIRGLFWGDSGETVPTRLLPSLPSPSSLSSAPNDWQSLRTGKALEVTECNPDLGRCPHPNAQQWVLLPSGHSIFPRTALQRAGGREGTLSSLPFRR